MLNSSGMLSTGECEDPRPSYWTGSKNFKISKKKLSQKSQKFLDKKIMNPKKSTRQKNLHKRPVTLAEMSYLNPSL